MAAKYLNQLTKGPIKLPYFGVLYGVESVGKTTFGDNLPDVVFVGPEKTARINGTRFPRPKDWQDFKEQLKDLQDADYKFKSLCVDSLDHLEQMLFEHMKQVEKKTAVEDCGGGYGKWVGLAQRHWLEVIALLEVLRDKKGMNILLLAHYQVKQFNDPLTALPYDRYQMKLNDKCAAIIREVVDFVFFANFKSSSYSKDANAKKGRGLSDGGRVVYTEKRASHDAKNRFSMPPELEFDYSVVMDFVDASKEDHLRDTQKDIEALMLDVQDAELLGKIKTHYEANKENIDVLRGVKNRLKVITGQEVQA